MNGGRLRRVGFLLSGLLLALLVNATQLSLIVLNLQGWRTDRLPDGWQIKVNRGTPEISAVKEEGNNSLRLRSHNSSYALERSVNVDPEEFPYLSWTWKVNQLPHSGDFRRAATDDQAAQVLVAFADRRILTYIWDTSAPKGTMQSASSIPLVHIFAVVCRSGDSEIHRWIAETRNVAEDYAKAYGRRAPRVKGVRLQINTQHTGSSAESQFGGVAFRNTRQ